MPKEQSTDGTIVVKIGGSTLGEHDTTLQDLVSMQREGLSPVVVHGGGKVITEWMAAQNVRPVFKNGLRVTDADSLQIVVAVLAGLINKELVAELAAVGGRALGLSGADGGMLTARVKDADLGYVGEVVSVDHDVDQVGAGVRVHPRHRAGCGQLRERSGPPQLAAQRQRRYGCRGDRVRDGVGKASVPDGRSGSAGQGSARGAEDDRGTGEGACERWDGLRGYDSKDRRMSARFEQWEHIADNRRERSGCASAVPGGRDVWDTDRIER